MSAILTTLEEKSKAFRNVESSFLALIDRIINGLSAVPSNQMASGGASGNSTVINLTANYAQQDERSLRSDVVLLQMLLGNT